MHTLNSRENWIVLFIAALVLFLCGVWFGSIGWAAYDAAIDLKIREIQKSSKKITDSVELRSLAISLLAIVDSAIDADDYVNAAKAINMAASFGTKSGNRQLVFRTKQRKDEVQLITNEFRSISKVKKNLETMPDDPDANRKVGLFLTAWKEQWQAGAELLLKAKNPLLEKIGQGELKPPDDLTELTQLARSWKEAGEAEAGTLRQRMLKRAYHWYQIAWRAAKGDAKRDLGKALSEMPFRYLTDMDELEVGEGSWPLGKYGETGGENRISIDGIKYELGLGMHPPAKGFFPVSYKLNGKYKTFNTGYALNDNITEFRGELRFSAYGDGRLLWKSSAFRKLNDAEFVTVDVKGIQVLEIRTECPEWAAHGHAVWLDPYVSK